MSGRCYLGKSILAAATISSPCGQGALMGGVLLGIVCILYNKRVLGCMLYNKRVLVL